MNPEQLLIVFVIVLLGVLVFHTLSNIVTGVKELATPKPGPCKKHDWFQIVDIESNKDLGLICGNCKKTPVDLQRAGSKE